MSTGLIAIPITFLLLFAFTFKFNKMSLVPSYLFILTVLSSTALITIWLHNLAFQEGSVLAHVMFVILIVLLVPVLLCGIYLLVIYLILNTRIVFKRERKSLAHTLPLMVAVLIILYLVARYITTAVLIPVEIQIMISSLYFTAVCHFFHLVSYLIANLLCNLHKPKLNQDYIIVHGCALIGKKPTPLLASRMDVAIAFYEKQKEKLGVAPKLILSGGQGADEEISEAEAMMLYAQTKGVKRQDILLEDKSTTTFENMKFSKKIIARHTDSAQYQAIFATSSYHVLRTGMYAKKMGMNLDGIGAKTAAYYFPNAIIREYIAYVLMHKKRILIFNLTILSIGCLLGLMIMINSHLQ